MKKICADYEKQLRSCDGYERGLQNGNEHKRQR